MTCLATNPLNAKVREDSMFSQSTYVQSNNGTLKSLTSSRNTLMSYVKKFTKSLYTMPLLAGLVAGAAIMPMTAQAEVQPMETITVIHRSSFDYALYQQTTEMLTQFNRELAQKIIVQARQDNVTMAKQFGYFTNQSNELAQIDKHPENIGVLVISE